MYNEVNVIKKVEGIQKNNKRCDAMIKSVKDLLNQAKQGQKMTLVVAAAQDEDVLYAVCKAAEEGVIVPILVGDQPEIERIGREQALDISNYTVIHEPDLTASARCAVQLVSEGRGDFLMKGLIDTAILLKAVLDKEIGLRTERLLSHVMIYEVPHYHKLLFLTDGGMNIAPTYEQKIGIAENAVDACKAMGGDVVKVAALAAKEKVNEKMPATVDARKLQELCETGHFGEGVVIEGPLALDLAVSEEAAKVKRFESRVAGDADVLLVPTIEVGNGIGKSLTYLAGAESAGVIMGAKVPVVLVSRADSYTAKLNSIALGSVIAEYQK